MRRSYSLITKKRIPEPLIVKLIKKKVSVEFGLRTSEMLNKRRLEKIAFPRQVAMYLSRKLGHESFNKIKIYFGKKEHATVIHACRRVSNRMETEPEMKSRINRLQLGIQAEFAILYARGAGFPVSLGQGRSPEGQFSVLRLE